MLTNWIKNFRPQDMIGLLRSNLGIFLLRKFGDVWVYIDNFFSVTQMVENFSK